MSGNSGPNIEEEGLVFAVDAANPKSYVSGSTTCNSLISNVTGTINNTGPTDEFWDPNNGGSWIFDGTDDYINFGDVLDFDYTDAFSFSAWIVRDGTGSDTILAKQETSGDYRGYDLFITSDFKIRLFLYSTASNRLDEKTANTLSTGAWYHIVATYDGSGDSVGIKIYINAVSETLTKGGNTSITGPSVNSIPFQIGARNSTDDYEGNISNVKIYNKALTATEVLQNYNALKSRFV